MKKVLIAAALVGSFTAAQAAEVGVYTGRNYDTGQNVVGITAPLTKAFGANITVGADRTISGPDVNRFNATAGYTVGKIAGVSITPKAGVAYVARDGAQDGLVGLYGVGAALPINKQVALFADYAYQKGQSKVGDLDGSIVTFGLNFKF